jgi:hypothetical protein
VCNQLNDLVMDSLNPFRLFLLLSYRVILSYGQMLRDRGVSGS